MHELVERLRRLSFEIAWRKMRLIDTTIDTEIFQFVSSLCHELEEYQWLYPTTPTNLWARAIESNVVRKFVTGLFTEFRLRGLGEDSQWDVLLDHFATAYSQLNDHKSAIGADIRKYIPLGDHARETLAGNPWMMPLILISTYTPEQFTRQITNG